VDNDGRSELVVGNVQGDLAIFKEEERNKPWRSCQDLGSIACVGVGDLCQIGQVYYNVMKKLYLKIRLAVLKCLKIKFDALIWNREKKMPFET
jgi:hypothetical protein